MTTAIYDNCRTGWNSCSTNASNERGLVNVLPTDADGLGLARRPSGVDIDIVIARSEIETGVSAHCDVAAARCIVKKRTVTDGRVEEPSPVEIECTNTASRVAPASRIAKERINAVGRIIIAGYVVFERFKTRGRVAAAGGVVHERIITEEGVRVDGIAAFLTSGLHSWEKPKTGEHERNQQERAQRRVVHSIS